MSMIQKFSGLDSECQQLIKDLADIENELLGTSVKNLTELIWQRDELRNELTAKGVDWNVIVDAFDPAPAPKKKASKTKGSSKSVKPAPYVKCAHKHPPVVIDGYGTIVGGSCYSPVGSYDIEIGFDGGMRTPDVLLPWGCQYVRYPIVDQRAPSNAKEFDRLVDWTLKQMKAGKTVHVGCIGGHGRTGTFLAALVFKATGNLDATKWLRDNYCSKAVETASQVEFLKSRYNITPVPPRHSKTVYEPLSAHDKSVVSGLSFAGSSTEPKNRIISPLRNRSIWGETKLT